MSLSARSSQNEIQVREGTFEYNISVSLSRSGFRAIKREHVRVYDVNDDNKCYLYYM